MGLPYEISFQAALHDLEHGRRIGATELRLTRELKSLVRAIDEVDPAAPQLGIDLVEHYEDVRRLTTYFTRSIAEREGWDMEELISDVVHALAVRNRGTCPFDPRLGSLSTYVVRVVQQEVSRRLQRAWSRPQLVPDTIVVHGEEVPLVVARDEADLEETIDVVRVWERARGTAPDVVAALVMHEGAVAPAARATGIRAETVKVVRDQLVARSGRSSS